MLTILIGTDWKRNTAVILDRLAQDVAEEKPNRILMVPELISHQTERDLAESAGDTASRFAEVLSFSRLAKRVSEDTRIPLLDCLDNGGRVVAMAAATRQLHSKLKAYAAVETKPEFLMSLLDAVDEFKRCCITSADLMEASHQTEGSLAQKLEELSLILQTYDLICSQSKRDPRDQMTWLLEQLESCDFAGDHTFYFNAFPNFSRQHMEIVFHLVSNSPNVIISLNCDEPGSHSLSFESAGQTAMDLIGYAIKNGIAYEVIKVSSANSVHSKISDHLLQGNFQQGFAGDVLEVYQADSVYAECAYTTEKIVALVQKGMRYRDISIVCSDMLTYRAAVNSMLQRAHIPVYISGTEDILDKTVIHTVLTALDAALSGFSQKEVILYLKSMLSPLSPEKCDRIENYAIMWSVDGSRWLQPWENHPRGLEDDWTEFDLKALESLNESRKKAMESLVQLRKEFLDAASVSGQVIAVYHFLENIQLSQQLKNLAASMEDKDDYRNAQILNQLWDILIGALEQMHDALSEVTWDGDTFCRLLKLLLRQYDVGTIPSVLDAVTVGSVSAMRCQKSRHLFVLGASEGVLPAYGSVAGVLNDQERAVLLSLGVPLNAGAIDGLQTQFSEIQEVFAGAQAGITVSCSDGQPSFIYNRLMRMAGSENKVSPRYGAALTDPWEAAAHLAAGEYAQEAVLLGLSDQYDSVMKSKNHVLGQIQPGNVRRLYGDKLHLSASQIDRVADCRMSYFLKYGMRARERNPVKIDPAEFGTYVHAVLEECGRAVVEMGGFKQVPLEKTLELAADASSRYFAKRFAQMNTERLSYHFRKNSREVQYIVRELWEELQDSEFQPVHFELGFGDEEIMPAIDISGKSMDAQLGGYVDRVDKWKNAGKEYIRVVDYKTGKKDFDYCDVFNGIGLQMLLYLYALEDGGELIFEDSPIAAGVQYFPARVPIVTSDGSLTEEEAQQAHIKGFKRKGLILSDDHVLQAMESSETPRRLSIKRKKDGTVSGDIASGNQFRQLKNYVFKLLEKIVDEIASGNVTPNPYTRGGSHDACRYCPYGSICHSTEIEGRRNYQAMSADRFWTEIERGESSNG